MPDMLTKPPTLPSSCTACDPGPVAETDVIRILPPTLPVGVICRPMVFSPVTAIDPAATVAAVVDVAGVTTSCNRSPEIGAWIETPSEF